MAISKSKLFHIWIGDGKKDPEDVANYTNTLLHGW